MNLEIIQFIVLFAFINILLSPFANMKQLCCGLVGFSGSKKANIDKLNLLMLHNSLKRGEDNTGIYTLETGVIKSDKKAEVFLQDKRIPRTNLFIGHVRKASVGSKMEKNAHPVEYDNIVLAHNGTLNNHMEMCRNNGYNWVTDFDTDTQVLAKLMDDNSKEEEIVYSTLSEYTGFAALLFTDKRNPDVLMAYRNEDRPLFAGTLPEGIYFSSLEENLKIIGCKEITIIPPFYLHSFKDGNVISSISYEMKKTIVLPVHRPNVTNVRYKDKITTDNIDEYIKSLKVVDATKIEDLTDRWVRAIISNDNTYNDQKTVSKVTKDDWYFILDSHSENDYDLQFIDDNGNTVFHNKFIFDISHISYPTGYCYAIKNIFEVGAPSNLLFASKSIIAICPNAKITEDNKLSCMLDDEIIDVEIDLIRPATQSEVDVFVENKAKEINKNLDEKQAQREIDFSKILPEPKISEELPTLSPFRSNEDAIYEFVSKEQIEEEYNSDDETVNVVTAILDVIDDKVDDIFELAESTQWPELQQSVDELKDLITESYNVDMVRQNIKQN